MDLRFLFPCLAVFFLSSRLAYGAQASPSTSWDESDMASSGKEKLFVEDVDQSEPIRGELVQRGFSFKIRLDSLRKTRRPPDENCSAEECFDLFYFRGDNFNPRDKRRKNILFIPGGPGEISPRRRGLPSFLEVGH